MVKTTVLKRDKVLVTARPGSLKNKAVLETKEGVPDVEVVAWPLWRQVAVRAGRTYIQSLLVFLLAGAASTGVQTGIEITVEAVGIAMPANEFLARFVSAGSMALGPAIVAVLQNAGEILAEWDNKRPGLRA